MFDHRPRRCPFGHDVGPGHAKVSWTPCGCRPALEANERGRGLGHITVTCSTCWDERRVTRFFEPPHDTRHPTARLGQAPARADPEAIPAWIEESRRRRAAADAAVAGRARQARIPLFNPPFTLWSAPGAVDFVFIVTGILPSLRPRRPPSVPALAVLRANSACHCRASAGPATVTAWPWCCTASELIAGAAACGLAG